MIVCRAPRRGQNDLRFAACLLIYCMCTTSAAQGKRTFLPAAGLADSCSTTYERDLAQKQLGVANSSAQKMAPQASLATTSSNGPKKLESAAPRLIWVSTSKSGAWLQTTRSQAAQQWSACQGSWLSAPTLVSRALCQIWSLQSSGKCQMSKCGLQLQTQAALSSSCMRIHMCVWRQAAADAASDLGQCSLVHVQ